MSESVDQDAGTIANPAADASAEFPTRLPP